MKAIINTRWALRPLMLATALFSASGLLAVQADELNQPIGKGVYELAFSPKDNAVFVATSQNSNGNGGTVFRLDPTTLAVQQSINSDLKAFGAAINPQTNVLYVGNTVEGSLTAIDASSGKVLNSLLLDGRKRSETVRPLQPRQVAVDVKTNRVYVTGLGPQSVVWVVDGSTLQLISTVPNTGKMATGLAVDSAAQKVYVTNGDGELVTLNARTNAIEKKQKIDGDKEHFFLNIALDTRGQRAFLSDSKQAQVLVVDLRTQQVIQRIDVPESLAVLFNQDRNELYVTHRKAGEVSIIDASNYRVKRSVKTPGLPNSLALSADGNTLYVSVKQPGSRKAPPKDPDSVMRIAL
ncbi:MULTISPECIES: 7-bladed beta-propeller protein YncE [Pantoea]|jgi:YVTN family beta-propeller protein|uniref:YncE family protein n=1 Tax=Pantoea brenneri TaxID=472694 RepID=A0A653PAH2_9GAMM|nr:MULTISPECIES: YncE family protein [Pantoea]MBS6033158.1 YncE family protein [Pantoea sp.]MBZ6394667.1 YncE family protein [Pantoea sp.]MBZ6440357.1 YncE family protein [Pantoea sp.]MCQ5471749.1 YncE family protein [Pantoea brenneri]MDH2122159.1 YncE family protein [Pantoea brenneri]